MANSEGTTAQRRDRPAVTVVVPFRGDRAAAAVLFKALRALQTRASDQILVVENSAAPELGPPGPGIEVVPAPDHPSSYYARNVGGERAGTEWLLFIDADCEPEPDLLDAYFGEPISAESGAIAGEIEPRDGDLLSRWAETRGLLRQGVNLAHPYRPSAVTANLLVRRTAWRSIGGFQERIRSGGDGDFAWRLQAAGWSLEHRPVAVVHHAHRVGLGDLARQLSRHASGAAWLNRRYPGSSPRPRLTRGLLRCLAGAGAWAVTGRFERAAFKVVDAAALIATGCGYLVSNAAAWDRRPSRGGVGLIVDEFPRELEAVNLARAGGADGPNRVAAGRRPAQPLVGGARGLWIEFHEDAAFLNRLAATLRLLARHPLRCLRLRLLPGQRRLPGGLPALALSGRVIGEHGVIDARFAGRLTEHASVLGSVMGRAVASA